VPEWGRGAISARRAAASDRAGYVDSRAANERKPLECFRALPLQRRQTLPDDGGRMGAHWPCTTSPWAAEPGSPPVSPRCRPPIRSPSTSTFEETTGRRAPVRRSRFRVLSTPARRRREGRPRRRAGANRSTSGRPHRGGTAVPSLRPLSEAFPSQADIVRRERHRSWRGPCPLPVRRHLPDTRAIPRGPRCRRMLQPSGERRMAASQHNRTDT
jgi:hypothetical protein